MPKYSESTLEKLLHNLDAIDVLEFIDYHPESFQRSGNVVTCFCPICQDHSGRFLSVDVEARTFVSDPPNMPKQTGTIIDLFARVRHMSLDEAAQELADEFGYLLVEDGESDPGELRDEAVELIGKANASLDEEERTSLCGEAEKRLRAVLLNDGDDLEAHRLLFDIRLVENNVFTLVPQLNELLRLEGEKGDVEHLGAAVEKYLARQPGDLAVRLKFADALLGLDALEQAVGELMTTADMAEQAGQVDLALKAYRRVQKAGEDIVDAHPMIVGLLMENGRRKEAVDEIEARTDYLRKKNRFMEASEEAARLLELRPEDYATTCLRVIELAIMGGLGKEGMERSLEMVAHLMERGQVGQAAEALSYLSAEEPENLTVLESLVAAYEKMNERDMATEFRHRLAEVAIKAGSLEKARVTLDALRQGHPGGVGVLRMSAELARAEGDAEKASALFQETLDALMRDGRKDEAAGVCGSILDLEPGRHVVRKGLVNLLLDLGRKEEALEEIDTLAAALEKSGAHEKAPELLESLLERLPDSPAVKLALASAYERLGDTARSQELRIQMLRQENLRPDETAEIEETATFLLRKNPEDPTILHLVARKLERDGDRDRARESYEKLATIHRAADRLLEARTALERIAALFPEDAEAHANLSALSAEMGDEAGVVRAARAQLDVHLAAGEYEAALEPAGTILDFLPSSEDAHLKLIRVLDALGREEEALEARRKLLAVLQEAGEERREIDVLEQLAKAAPTDHKLHERLLELLARQPDSEGLGERIEEYLAGRKFGADKRIRFLRSLAAKAPDRVEVRRVLARELHKAGRTTEMNEEITALVEEAEERGDSDRAAALLKELTRLAPEQIDARRRLAEWLEKMERNGEAVEQHLAIAWQLQKERKLREADQQFERMYRLAPGNEEIYTSHAELLRDMGDDAQAAIRLCELARLLSSRGEHDRALTVLNKLLVFDADNTEARRQIIVIKGRKGGAAEALEDLKALVRQLHKEGDQQGALLAARDAVELDGASPEARELLVAQLEGAGREIELVRERINLARLYTEAGRHGEGLALLDTILEEDGENIQARSTRAAIYDAMGDSDKALSEYRTVQESVQRMSGQTPIPLAGSPAPAPVMTAERNGGELELLPEYDFDSFVVGRRNSFAFATAKAVAEKPGAERNPLFLYADVGLGKTHLLHGIANHVRRTRPDIRIHYSIAVYFTNELEEAIAGDAVGRFRDRYKGADLLLLDDVQFLAGNEKSQEEFFHLFNIVYQRKGQIVLTSDRPPKDIQELDKRLRSRFGQGVIVEIQPPDADTRLKILEKERERAGGDLPDDVLAVIAESIDSNVRDLKGAFNQLVALREIGGEPVDAAVARETIGRYYSS